MSYTPTAKQAESVENLREVFARAKADLDIINNQSVDPTKFCLMMALLSMDRVASDGSDEGQLLAVIHKTKPEIYWRSVNGLCQKDMEIAAHGLAMLEQLDIALKAEKEAGHEG